MPGTPGLFWVNSRPPVLVSPPAEPRSTLTAPAWETVPTSSSGAAAAERAAERVLEADAQRDGEAIDHQQRIERQHQQAGILRELVTKAEDEGEAKEQATN